MTDGENILQSFSSIHCYGQPLQMTWVTSDFDRAELDLKPGYSKVSCNIN